MADQNPMQSGGGNVYAPPEARVDDVVPEGELELAERGTRLAAAILDGLCLGGIGIIAAIAIPAAQQSGGSAFVWIGLGVIGLLVVIVLNCMWIHQLGQTIGKRIMKIKTVRSDGERCGLVRVFFLRYLPTALMSAVPYVGWIVGLTDSCLIFRETRKCLHDHIADTIVIKV